MCSFLLAFLDVLFCRLDSLLIISAIEISIVSRQIFFGWKGILPDQTAFITGHVAEAF